MAVAHVQGVATGNAGQTTSVTTAAITTTSGNLLIAWATCAGNPTITFSDSKSNTWNYVYVTSRDAGNDQAHRMGYAYNITGGASHTVTASWGGLEVESRFVVMEVSGVQTSADPLVTSNHTESATGTAPAVTTSGSANDGDFVASCGIDDSSSGTLSKPTDFTQSVTTAIGHNEGIAAYRTKSGAGTSTATWANTASDNHLLGIATFIAAGGATTTRGRAFGQRGNAFNGGRTFYGIIDGIATEAKRIFAPGLPAGMVRRSSGLIAPAGVA